MTLRYPSVLETSRNSVLLYVHNVYSTVFMLWALDQAVDPIWPALLGNLPLYRVKPWLRCPLFAQLQCDFLLLSVEYLRPHVDTLQQPKQVARRAKMLQ